MRGHHASLVGLLLTSAAWAQAPAVSSLKTYLGPDGQRVEVVTLLPLERNAGLVRVTGADSPLDGLVLPGRFEGRGGASRAFVTTLRGGSSELLRLESGRVTAFVLDGRSFDAKFTAGSTPQADAALGQELVALAAQQAREGQLGLAQRKPFPHLEKKYQAQADAALSEVNRSCGTAATFRFEWGFFPDEVMAERDVWALCAPVLAAAKKVCPKPNVYACRFGPALELTWAEGTLRFTTSPSGKEQGAAFLAGRLERAP